ncbi:L-arabinose isomerase [Aquisalinus flavus]|uniref:L-arabinose isomerase n=1 Tax=Aquisalinus flavus TaxID=1526572 RepID=A0A8J2V2I5_9PROT|nr:L-arabinose isomerase [Aquisalinus flavus]MBD0427415.1 L-arabinose isomerase [Aquisalinus flavus]UNE47218.1 L-arabinose isomerase [Aquisalinus flavus]GGD00815.1 L-arabinose isomerase [Aquisalinus flavus]
MLPSDLKAHKLWFVVGSQHLYGPKVLEQVEQNAREIAGALGQLPSMPASLEFKAVVTTPSEVLRVMKEANQSDECVGLVLWMHTFSPAKMWIAGLTQLQKPFLHLNTQFNRDIPWSEIDMDFMNLNQSAHGDREFGYICSRLRIERRVVAGHWKDPSVQQQIADWSRVAIGRHTLRTTRIARFGDNMRRVAVTEGDKVEAEMKLGATVDGYGLGDLAERVDAVSDGRVEEDIDRVSELYTVPGDLARGGDRHQSLIDALRIELGIRDFLQDNDYQGFTTTFEILHGLKQLPGIGAQRIMADGYGFGAEGDWKTAVLVRTMKMMAHGLDGGTSFMEDYTYHLDENGTCVLGSHMLEICPTIAADKPRLAVHPLAIGGKEDPVRLIFTTPEGPAINVSMMDMGNRFRLVCGELDVLHRTESMPKLPVASAFWNTKPDFATGTAAWIQAGGAHHSCFSMSLKTHQIRDLAEMVGIELLVIDGDTTIDRFKAEIRANEAYYK